jgi:inner membrane protein
LDNLTHTLIGLAVGEAAARVRPADRDEPTRTGLSWEVRRTLFITLAAVGGNLPDLDLLWSFRWGGRDKLGYLLQHRGYTHTVLGCLALALLLYVGVELWMRWRLLTPTRRDRAEVAGMALLGTFLHLAMDALNSYGVHPFWPLRNDWLYGDSIFILEPLYWIAIAPLLFVVRSVYTRAILAVVLVLALVVSVLASAEHSGWPIALGILIALLLWVGRSSSARAAAFTSATFMICVTGTFVCASRIAAAAIEQTATERFPSDHIIDHVLTPSPTNPLCWDILLLETDGDQYSVRHGVLAIAPRLMPAGQCPDVTASTRITAPLHAVSAPDTAKIRWLGEFSMARQHLVTLARSYCEAAELLQFARAPFATQIGRGWVIGDLRFDREPQLGMSELALGANPDGRSGPARGGDPDRRQCRSSVPWTPPRAELLRDP